MTFFDSFNLWLLWGLLAADVVTTLVAFKGGASEANPVMRALMGWMGIVPALLVTHVAAGGFAWYIGPTVGPHMLWIISGGFALVVASNLRVIALQRA